MFSGLEMCRTVQNKTFVIFCSYLSARWYTRRCCAIAKSDETKSGLPLNVGVLFITQNRFHNKIVIRLGYLVSSVCSYHKMACVLSTASLLAFRD